MKVLIFVDTISCNEQDLSEELLSLIFLNNSSSMWLLSSLFFLACLFFLLLKTVTGTDLFADYPFLKFLFPWIYLYLLEILKIFLFVFNFPIKFHSNFSKNEKTMFLALTSNSTSLMLTTPIEKAITTIYVHTAEFDTGIKNEIITFFRKTGGHHAKQNKVDSEEQILLLYSDLCFKITVLISESSNLLSLITSTNRSLRKLAVLCSQPERGEWCLLVLSWVSPLFVV